MAAEAVEIAQPYRGYHTGAVWVAVCIQKVDRQPGALLVPVDGDIDAAFVLTELVDGSILAQPHIQKNYVTS